MGFNEYFNIPVPFNDFVIRGYEIWQWNFLMVEAATEGICGISTNYVGEYSNLIKSIYPKELLYMEGNNIENAQFDLVATRFSGENITLKANVFKYKETGNGYDAVLMVKTTGEEGNFDGDFYYFVNATVVKKGGGVVLPIIISVVILAVVAFLVSYFVIRKKKLTK